MSRFVGLSYKELQCIAKEINIPANLKRALMENAIEAYRDNNIDILNSILTYNKSKRRKKFRASSTDKRKRRISKNRSKDQIVDSTSADSRDNPVIVNYSVPPPDMYADVTTSNIQDRYAYLSRFYPNQQYFNDLQMLSDYTQFNSAANASSYTTNGYQTIPNPCSPPPFIPISRTSLQDSSSHPYTESGTTFYQSSFAQGYNANNVSNNYGSYLRENYVPVQVQQYSANARFCDTNYLQPSNFENQLRVSPNMYSKMVNNQLPAIEIDCPSYLLPNIPQLDVNVPENNSVLSQNSFVPNNSVRNNQFASKYILPDNMYKENVDNLQPPPPLSTIVIDDCDSISSEIDSASDEETVSIPGDDIINLLDSDNGSETRHAPSGPLKRRSSSNLDHPKVITTEKFIPNLDNELEISGKCFNDFYGNSEPLDCVKIFQNSVIENENRNFVDFQPLTSYGNTVADQNDAALPCVSTLFADNLNSHNLRTCEKNLIEDANDCVSVELARETVTPLEHGYSTLLYDLSKSENKPRTEMVRTHTKNTPILEFSSFLNNLSPAFISEIFTGLNKHVSFADASSLRKILNQCPQPIKEKATHVLYKRETISIIKEVYNRALNAKEMNSPTTRRKLTYPSIPNDTSLPENLKAKRIASVDDVSAEIAKTYSDICRPCSFNFEGCGIIVKTDLADFHEKQCSYRPVHCPIDDCPWYQSMNSLRGHVYQNHHTDLRIKDEELYVIEKDDKSFTTYFQLHNDIMYVITLHINNEAKKCVVDLQYIPNSQVIKIKNKRVRGIMQLIYFTPKVKIKSWKGVIQPYDENYEINEPKHGKNNSIQCDIGNSMHIVLHVLLE